MSSRSTHLTTIDSIILVKLIFLKTFLIPKRQPLEALPLLKTLFAGIQQRVNCSKYLSKSLQSTRKISQNNL